jgi:hypothetical protein
MKFIKLTRGYVTKVDDEDFEYLSQFNWHYDGRYATRTQWNKETKKDYKVYMHHVITNFTPGKDKAIDHRDTDKLNNQRKNLREVNKSKNEANKTKQPKRKTSSKYKGVTLRKGRRKCWYASCMKDSKLHSIGYFPTEEEAALAYNEKAKELHGEFAHLNEVD